MKIYKNYKDYPIEKWRWPNFSPAEMASKGDGELGIDEAAMDKLQALRDVLGKPLIINSAYRSAAHNRKVNGAPASEHLKGRAFDVSMVNQNPDMFEQAARHVGFTGFGFYPEANNNFIHIDTGPPRKWGTRFKIGPTGRPEEPKPDTAGAKATGIAGAGAVIAVAADHLPIANTILSNLAPIAQAIAVGAIVLALVWFFWRNSRDR